MRSSFFGQALHNCQDSPDAIPNELLKLGKVISKFRNTLTERARYLKEAKTRGEKRKVRLESENAWNTLLDKQDQSTRMSHQFWKVAKNPLNAGDILVERDKLDQAILKVQGLTDLWRVIYDAPAIELNMKLVKNLFQIDVKRSEWDSIAQVVKELETIIRRNTELSLPNIE